MQPIQYHARTLRGGVKFKGNRKKHKGSRTFKRKKRKRAKRDGETSFPPRRTPESKKETAWAKELEMIAAERKAARSGMGKRRKNSL